MISPSASPAIARGVDAPDNEARNNAHEDVPTHHGIAETPFQRSLKADQGLRPVSANVGLHRHIDDPRQHRFRKDCSSEDASELPELGWMVCDIGKTITPQMAANTARRAAPARTIESISTESERNGRPLLRSPRLPCTAAKRFTWFPCRCGVAMATVAPKERNREFSVTKGRRNVLIRRGQRRAVDDQDLTRTALRIEFQTEVLLQGPHQRRPLRQVGRCVGQVDPELRVHPHQGRHVNSDP